MDSKLLSKVAHKKASVDKQTGTGSGTPAGPKKSQQSGRSRKKKHKRRPDKPSNGKNSSSPDNDIDPGDTVSETAGFDSDASISRNQLNVQGSPLPARVPPVTDSRSHDHDMNLEDRSSGGLNQKAPKSHTPPSSKTKSSSKLKGAVPRNSTEKPVWLSGKSSGSNASVSKNVRQQQANAKLSNSASVTMPPIINQDSLRWEMEMEDSDAEEERLKQYKLNRRKRYLAATNKSHTDWLSSSSSTSLASSHQGNELIKSHSNSESASATSASKPPRHLRRETVLHERYSGASGLSHKSSSHSLEIMLNC